MPNTADQRVPIICPQCGTHIAPSLLSCPSCHQLTYADELKKLAAEAERATHANDIAAALGAWRRALELLPRDSRQHEAISATINELGKKVDSAELAKIEEAKKRPAWAKGATGFGVLGLLLWKFKFILVLVFTKGKLLLLGLTKMSTLISMLLSFGVYWTLWGWKFALGLVVSIYVHEMGHVVALTRYGIRATAPMFIPGVGAVVRLKQSPANPREDARVGLAGPIWGLGAAVAAYLVYLVTDWPSWAAIARVGAWINLFNLLPIWQLDGGRGFRTLTQPQRWFIAAVIAGMWFLTGEGLLVLLLILAVVRASGKSDATEADRIGMWQFAFLVAALSLMCMIHVPVPASQ